MRDQFIKQQIKIIFYILIIFIFLSKQVNAFENKIKYKINNQIVTSIDIELETQYLLALNPALNNFNKKEIEEISVKSILNEKIKEQEIDKFFKKKEIPKKYLEQLLKNIYNKIGIDSLENFKSYLDNKSISYQIVLDKIAIEALWNEIILAKFSSKIKIDEQELKKQINSNKNKLQKSFLMSEIFFELKKNEKLDKKFDEIEKVIIKNGFDNAALKYSISQTANIGGKLNWINENSLNKIIREKINSTKIGKYTDPIRVAGGFLILKVNETKTLEKNIDIEKELKKTISEKRNDQLNQFSKLYFNKIKNNMKIDEI